MYSNFLLTFACIFFISQHYRCYCLYHLHNTFSCVYLVLSNLAAFQKYPPIICRTNSAAALRKIKMYGKTLCRSVTLNTKERYRESSGIDKRIDTHKGDPKKINKKKRALDIQQRKLNHNAL